MTVVVDPDRAEVRGPGAEIRALLSGSDEPGPPLLADGLRAARAPIARFRVTGLREPLEALADQRAAALVLRTAGGETALRACTPSGMLGLLVRAVGLGPRPRGGLVLGPPPCGGVGLGLQPPGGVGLGPQSRGGESIMLDAARMAGVVNDRSATGAGLSEADEERLQSHLDALVAHWRIEAHGPQAGWYLEVLDSERGLWTVEDAPDRQLALTPVDATAVLDELAALPGHVGLGPDSVS